MNKQHTVSLVILLLMFVVQAHADNKQESENIQQLKELGRRCLDFAQDNNGKLPPNLATLHYKAYVNRLKLFNSPAIGKGVVARTKIDAKSDYVLSYRAHLIPGMDVRAGQPIENGIIIEAPIALTRGTLFRSSRIARQSIMAAREFMFSTAMD
jgi:hypothetical protein